jgi:polyisoprenoid-binding protein YceI
LQQRPTGNEQRDAHIASADFFEVEKYPTVTFRLTGVRANGMGDGEAARFEPRRSCNDFGIDIGIPLETGGAVASDKVTITLDIEALNQA